MLRRVWMVGKPSAA